MGVFRALVIIMQTFSAGTVFCAHIIAAPATPKQALENECMLNFSLRVNSLWSLKLKRSVCFMPEFLIYYGFVLSGIAFIMMPDLTDIDSIFKHMRDILIKKLVSTSFCVSSSRNIFFRPVAVAI